MFERTEPMEVEITRAKRKHSDQNSNKPKKTSVEPEPEKEAEISSSRNKAMEEKETENMQPEAPSTQQDATDNVRRKNEEDIVVFIRGKTQDLTPVNPVRVIKALEEMIGREPDLSKSGISVRLRCKDDNERQELLKENLYERASLFV